MPHCTLTRLFVLHAACPPGRRKIEYYDVKWAGFLLEVRASGGKTFYQRYTDERGRERQYRLGPAHVISVTQARQKAKKILAEALLGPDPTQQRRALRSVPTLHAFVAQRYLPYVQTYKSSWKTDETVLRIHILPKLGSLALDEIKSEAISNLVNSMRADGYTAPGRGSTAPRFWNARRTC